MRLRRRARALAELQTRLESGDPGAYDEMPPPVYEQVRDSVWGQVRSVYDPDADPADPDVYTDPRLPGGFRDETRES